MADLGKRIEEADESSRVSIERPNPERDIETIIEKCDPFILNWTKFKEVEGRIRQEAERIFQERISSGKKYTDLEEHYRDNERELYEAQQDRDWDRGKKEVLKPILKEALKKGKLVSIRPKSEDLETICMQRSIFLIEKSNIDNLPSLMEGRDIVLVENDMYPKIRSKLGGRGHKSEEIALQSIQEVVYEELKKPKLLVVDDDPAWRKLIQTISLEEGYISYAAGDADGALKVLEEEKDIGVVVSDMTLPGMNGVELAIRLSEDGSNRNIILATENIGDESAYGNVDSSKLLTANIRAVLGKSANSQLRKELKKARIDLGYEGKGKGHERIEKPTFGDFETRIRDFNESIEREGLSVEYYKLNPDAINELLRSFRNNFSRSEDMDTLATLNKDDIRYIQNLYNILIDAPDNDKKAILKIIGGEDSPEHVIFDYFCTKIRDGWAGEDIHLLFADVLRKGEELDEITARIWRNRRNSDEELMIERQMREQSDARTSIFYRPENIGRVVEIYPHYAKHLNEKGEASIRYNLGITSKRVAWVAQNYTLLEKYLEMYGTERGREEHDDLIKSINQDKKEEAVSYKESRNTVDSKYQVYDVSSIFSDGSKRHSIVKVIDNDKSFDREVYHYNWFKRYGVNDVNNLMTRTIIDKYEKKSYVVVLNFKSGVKPRENLMAEFERLESILQRYVIDMDTIRAQNTREEITNLGINVLGDVGVIHGSAPIKKGAPYTAGHSDVKGYVHFRMEEFQENLDRLMREIAPELSEELKKHPVPVDPSSSIADYIADMDPIFYKDCVTKNMTRIGKKEKGGEGKRRDVKKLASLDYGEIRKLPLAFDIANAVMTMYLLDIRQEEEKGTIDRMLVSYLKGYCEGLKKYNDELSRKMEGNAGEFFASDFRKLKGWTDDRQTKRDLDELVKKLETGKQSSMRSCRNMMNMFAREKESEELARFVKNEIEYSHELTRKRDPYFSNVKTTYDRKRGSTKYDKIIEDLSNKEKASWGRGLTNVFERLKADLYVSMAYRGQVIANTVPVYILSDLNVTADRKKYFHSLVENTIQAIDVLCDKYVGKEKEKYLRTPLDEKELRQTRNSLVAISNVFGKIEEGQRVVKNGS